MREKGVKTGVLRGFSGVRQRKVLKKLEKMNTKGTQVRFSGKKKSFFEEKARRKGPNGPKRVAHAFSDTLVSGKIREKDGKFFGTLLISQSCEETCVTWLCFPKAFRLKTCFGGV